MTNSYKDEIQELKQQRWRWRRLMFGLIGGAMVLVVLCGVVNFTFFAAGVALGNVWPFSLPANNSSPHLIASYRVNQVPEPRPVVNNNRLYRETFEAGFPQNWQTFADGWDVQRGIFYGTNTRGDASTAAIYGGGTYWRDVIVEADVTAVTAATPSSAQLLFRTQSEAVTGRCQLATRATGQRQLQLITPEGQLLASSFHFTTGDAYRLRATAVGDTLTCEILGYPATHLSATTTILQGTVGLQNQNMTAAFDNLEVLSN